MSTNPNPSRVTEELWAFWLAFKALEPKARLAGTYAQKPGYHNARENLPADDYSVGQYAADRQGPVDKTAAIDITFPDAQAGDFRTIAKYSARLLASGRDPHDERGNYLREFYGNADSDREVEGWDYQAVEACSSDDSHLWHIHLSFLRAFLRDARAFRAILSILKGETVAAWRLAEGITKAPAPKPPAPAKPRLRRAWPAYMPANHYYGLRTGPNESHGGYYAPERPDVKAIQTRLAALGHACPTDGNYGPTTKAAVTAWQRKRYAAQTSRYGEVWRDDWVRLFTY